MWLIIGGLRYRLNSISVTVCAPEADQWQTVSSSRQSLYVGIQCSGQPSPTSKSCTQAAKWRVCITSQAEMGQQLDWQGCNLAATSSQASQSHVCVAKWHAVDREGLANVAPATFLWDANYMLPCEPGAYLQIFHLKISTPSLTNILLLKMFSIFSLSLF